MKYKCPKCSNLYPQIKIDNIEFRKYNKFQRKLDIENLEKEIKLIKKLLRKLNTKIVPKKKLLKLPKKVRNKLIKKQKKKLTKKQRKLITRELAITWILTNLDKYKELINRYYLKIKQKRLESNRNWRRNNKEKRKIQRRLHRINNLEKERTLGRIKRQRGLQKALALLTIEKEL